MRFPRIPTRVATVLAAAATVAASLAAGTATPASAAVGSMTISGWSLPTDRMYGIGFDAVNTAGQSPGGYERYYEWSAAGASVNAVNPQLPARVSFSAGFAMSELRWEIYSFPIGPAPCPTATCRTYDPLQGDGAVTVRIPGTSGAHDIGAISIPRTGEPGTGSLSGRVSSHAAIDEGRVTLDIFQTTGFRRSSTGYELDAFSSGRSTGGTYGTGPLWDGRYIAFVTDHATGTRAVGMIDVAGVTTFDLDLDVPCFGIDDCEFSGTAPAVAGGYHPVGPNRVLDTRIGLGISEAVQPGDGRNTDPNDVKRLASRLNHEFVVTGVGGVPSRGVGAVLLNVTAAGSSTSGVAKIFPKPANTAWYDDESSFPASNPSGPLLVWGAGEDIANLMLVPVGVGGRLRIENFSPAAVHVVADVVGWFDLGQAGQTGSRLTAIAPTRLLDSRNGIGGPAAPFGAGESRTLPMTGGGIPTDASAVVATATGVTPTTGTYLTIWPAGTGRQETSVLNLGAGDVRPNLVAVGTGAGGAWSLFNAYGSNDVLVDAVGYFRPGSGGLVTPLPAATVLDTQAGAGGPRRAFGPGEARDVPIAGRGGVPGDARAVFLSVTASFGTDSSFLTVWGDGAPPETSNLNWFAGTARSNLVLVPLGPGGTVKLSNARGTVQLVADVVAFVR